MTKSIINFFLFLFFYILILSACNRYGDVDKYIIHTNKINSIIKENTYNTDLAGAAILQYTKENQTAIEATIKNLNAYTIGQTIFNYNRLMEPVLKLKQQLSKPPAVYPDSVRMEIMKVLSENQAAVDKQAEELQKNSKSFLKTAFIPANAALILIKQLIAEIPIENYKLANNPDFIEAAKIMCFDNLVLSAY